MELLVYVFLMLLAILASNIINHLLPSVSTPIMQIVLGALIGLLPLPFHLYLQPEWFFVLFIAPLLFHDGIMANREALWAQRKPIFLLAFGLVFLTVLLIGYLSDLIIPSMPLAAAFALAAAVTPTDAVAVSSLAKRIPIPHGIMHLLEGESLINDASGLVSFQFAVAAMVTGVFSLVDAGVDLIFVVAGGVLVGAAITVLKFLLVRWIRSLGMEDITFHLLIGILTPFVIYLAAEHLHVSGILAVVTAGIVHSFEARRINPDVVSLRVASESVWRMITYVLNGLVFVILGTQLPDILESVRLHAQIDQRIVLLDVLAITAALMAIRFAWAYFTLNQETRAAEGHTLSRMRSSAVVSMAGVRGAVTLASALSLPFVLADGSPFPFRDTIIFIASMVILLSLLIANFLLPLLLGRGKESTSALDETDARIRLLQEVVKQLNEQSNSTNLLATSQVVREYYGRIAELESQRGWSRAEREMENDLRGRALEWERENTLAYVEQNHLDPAQAKGLLASIEKMSARRSGTRAAASRRITQWLYLLRDGRHNKESAEERAARWQDIYAIARANAAHVIAKLRSVENGENRGVVERLIAEQELATALLEQRYAVVTNRTLDGGALPDDSEEQLATVSKQALQFERDGIQRMFEEGRISRATAAEMRNNLELAALRLRKDFLLDEGQMVGSAAAGSQ